MEPFIWIWLGKDKREWPRTIRGVPTGTTLIVPDGLPAAVALAWGQRLGRSDLKVLPAREVVGIMGLWRLKRACRGTSCIGGEDDAPRGSRLKAAISQHERQRAEDRRAEVARVAASLDGAPSSIFPGRHPGTVAHPKRQAVPGWVRRRRGLEKLAAAGVVAG